MTIPTYEQAMIPTLRVLESGGILSRRQILEEVCDLLKLTAEERGQLVPSGRGTLIRGRVGWALTYMKQAGLVETVKRGVYRITERGRQGLASSPQGIDSKYLTRYPEFVEFVERSRADSSNSEDEGANEPAAASPEPSPEEALDSSYKRLKLALQVELLDALRTGSPSFFETVVVDVLVKMGYGGSRPEAARAVGKSGDGGIDGVIDEDRLGLDVIYIQAKRWDGTVGRPEIQKFAGALQGHRARKGVFITTSAFTRDAIEYAHRIDTKIVLIDGVRLAELMFDYDVGVTPRATYILKQLDTDYFDELPNSGGV